MAHRCFGITSSGTRCKRKLTDCDYCGVHKKCKVLECVICYERIENYLTLTCGHTFCKHCISMWIARHNTCPCCRTIISSRDISRSVRYCCEIDYARKIYITNYYFGSLSPDDYTFFADYVRPVAINQNFQQVLDHITINERAFQIFKNVPVKKYFKYVINENNIVTHLHCFLK